ncbi:GNAT family N-acetyltransferase [Alkaliphilus peptidifermentans]|uniref:Acetyltransferase (GNAT) family protein n=1 Tax=Alkaliphilus peptidifermentans DSM 18978 TaxID=1120976 RepID=A0A1G5ESS0_9FIRM|nr:GNAT family N-acetyltransferase [Alkaliphilus peptidifermentans]SCY30049.1 Acetyltransferase (GNAT) family protein [Alkaliphilus peptidifermentans DSM 18978]
MNFEICNPKEDQYGNSKDNIFLAFDISGNYLGSAYTYPSINYYQIYGTPYIIFIDVIVESNDDKDLYKEVRQQLLEKVYSRAMDLRKERPDLKARIYSGFNYDEEKLDFYLGNGFNEDYSIIMEATILESHSYNLPKNVRVTDCRLDLEESIMEYKRIYDDIFITPIEANILREQANYNHFKNLYFSIKGRIQGGCTIFEKDGFGYIETVYVLPEAQGNGISKIIVSYILQYFLSLGLNKTRLEVWKSNKRAVELYKSFGYNEAQKNLMFPYIIP